ncbi:ABC transporter permease [Clostridium sp. D2Q-14]|uniref:ABC transporter permease n=1 Tax=Anaeromonas gelatinilytica TaxID=2683194 RepID=UPI00193BC780|nr:ABC transporter permease [Anaeromonas gelatinilytica]MBS4534454.1 ABC transporter permease [Anaeromonas gelatinilytica]
MNTITGLAVNNDKKNKTRSILIIVSIILTTMLLTIIATFCYGVIKSNRTNTEQLYGSYYGTYKGINEEQIQEMELRSEFTDIGKMAFVGEVINKSDISLYYADKTTYELTNLSEYLDEGAFPENEDEIIAEKSFFEALGYDNLQIGDKISLNSRKDSDSTYEKKELVISGLLKESVAETTKKTYVGYVSEEYYENQVAANKRYYSVYFRLNDSVDITSDEAEDLLKELAIKCGISEKKVSVNDYYLMWSLDPGMETILGGLLIAFCVIIFSVIVIYNIFQVGIVQKIQEYGKLKALGATKKQLKRVVMIEGMLLSGIGVPVGLIIGCILSKFTFSWLMEQSNSLRAGADLIEVSIFSVPVLILVVVVSFLTVYLAIRKPMKTVAGISPVEAMRYQENTSRKRSLRKGKKVVGVKEMTLASLSANRKRTIVTVCTMGLSCVLFVVIANFVGNMDNEYDARKSVEYGQFLIRLDYSLNDTAYPENNLDSILKENLLGTDLVTKIKQIDGVTDVRTRKVLALKETDETGQETGNMSSVAVLNEEDFNNFKSRGGNMGTLDYDTASEENGILYGWSHFMEDYGYSLNQNILTQLENGISQVSFTGTIQGSFGNCDQDWGITEDTYKKLGFTEDGIGYIWVDCEENNLTTVQKELKELLTDKEHVELETYQDALKTSQFSTRMMKMASYTLLAILGIIGFMNMTNTLIVSIITRKQEIGVLQAIGMTNQQLNRMFQMEGFVFTIGTVIVAMAVGIPAGYAMFCYGKSQSWIGLNIYHFPLLEIVIMIAVITILQIVLSFVLSRNIRKESLIERIRYQE